MDFEYSERSLDYQRRVRAFLEDLILPAEATYHEQIQAAGDPHFYPPVMETLKAEARKRGLWNLFLPHETEWTTGFSNLDYAPLAELMGRSWIGSEPFNCSAPDTGNMEILAMFGTPEQQKQWLRPLLAGEIRSGFCMTEPAVASSDAQNVQTRIERVGDEYVINGRKWFTGGAGDERCELLIVMGKSDPLASRHRQQSMVLVPRNTPGVKLERSLSIFGYHDQPGHMEISFSEVRIPAKNILVGAGEGFAIAQARLGPGRIHHCMRAIGIAERALELMCSRVRNRVAFGAPLADLGVVQQWIADSRIEIEQARLLTLKAAWLMDRVGAKGAHTEISAIKVVAPAMAARVVDRAIQAHGAAGVTGDTVLAYSYAILRGLRIADGPDEVHRRTLARHELQRSASREEAS
ncbi:acyl-CoA dehydrogenase family protein [Nocardioides sp.]|uniref:acyl-CoA dehydrogenase family protein n=1 Tax=Nocardioides sp. TaxID=35761 RepID=UPI00262FEDFA|nr:acyl-CoA dehydrogenase family protein [Nocardioides sp.]MDI6912322.1 acyl-CoA dehydrogenase family protein [Nocardioides sp.]